MEDSDYSQASPLHRGSLVVLVGVGIVFIALVALVVHRLSVIGGRPEGGETVLQQTAPDAVKRPRVVHVNDPYRPNARPNGPPPSLCDLPCKTLRLDEGSLYEARSLGKGFIVPGGHFVQSVFRDGARRLVLVSLNDLCARWQTDADVNLKSCRYVSGLDALAFISERKFIDVFDCTTGRRLARRKSTAPYDIHDFTITSDGAWTLAWSREMTRLAVADVFDRNGTEPIFTLQNAFGEEAAIIDAAANIVATQHFEGTRSDPGLSHLQRIEGARQVVAIVNLNTGQTIRTIKLTPHIGAIHPELFLDQSRIVVREGGLLSVVDWQTGALCAQLKAYGFIHPVPGTDQLFVCDGDRAQVWDFTTDRIRHQAPLGGVRVAVSPGRSVFAVIRQDTATITFSTMQTCLPQLRIEIPEDVIHTRQSIAFSPDGSLIMVLTKKGMRIIRWSDARQIAIITDEKAIASLGLAFSETNRHLMTDSEVWELVESR